MKIFWPDTLNDPSPFGTPLERNRPRSVPQCGSVRFMVPVHSPETIFGRYVCFCWSEPNPSIALIAPWVRP